MKHRFYLLLLAGLTLACQKQPELHGLRGQALGTTYSIRYVNDVELTDGKKKLNTLFSAINQSMSTYLPDSDISKINKGQESSVQVDEDFEKVFEISQEVHQKTDGYFDPTVGKLVNAWGFGPEKYTFKMDSAKVKSLMQHVGFEKVGFKNRYVQKESPEVYLDFNAVAKGYTIDKIGALFEKQGIDNYLIELGGELLAKGTKPDSIPWIVGIDHPLQKEKRELITTFPLRDGAMATSGNYRKFSVDTLTGQKFVHMVDPKTGFTRESSVLSVSVLAKDCATADAYATAFMLMPIEVSQKIVEKDQTLEAYFVTSGAQGSFEVVQSTGFPVK